MVDEAMHEIESAFERASVAQGTRAYDSREDGFYQFEILYTLGLAFKDDPGLTKKMNKLLGVIFGKATAGMVLSGDEVTLKKIDEAREKNPHVMLPHVDLQT